jgi:uncharacterized membrane protein
LIGGFSAPLMISTGQSNYLFLFIYLSLLNAGMLAAAFLKHWKSVGWTAYIFTSLYLFSWTADQPELLSITFYIISYIIFYIFALLDYFRKNTLSTSDILMLAFINFQALSDWFIPSINYNMNRLLFSHLFLLQSILFSSLKNTEEKALGFLILYLPG